MKKTPLQRLVAVVALANAGMAAPEIAMQPVRRVPMADLATAMTAVAGLVIAPRSKTVAPAWETPLSARSAMPWSTRSWH